MVFEALAGAAWKLARGTAGERGEGGGERAAGWCSPPPPPSRWTWATAPTFRSAPRNTRNRAALGEPAERTRGSPESPTPGSPGALQHHLPGGPGGVSAGGPGGASAALRAPPRDPSAFPVPTGRGNPAAILCFFLAVLVLLLQLAEPLPVASAGESPRAAPRRVPAGLLSRDQVTSAWLPTTLRGRRRGGNHRSWGWRGCRAKPKRRLSVQ